MNIRFIPSRWPTEKYWLDFGFRIALYRYAGGWSLIPLITFGRRNYSLRITNMSNG